MSKTNTLDQFFGTAPVKRAPEERCSNPRCRKLLTGKEPKYEISKKGKTCIYCQPCAKAILHPQESAESI